MRFLCVRSRSCAISRQFLRSRRKKRTRKFLRKEFESVTDDLGRIRGFVVLFSFQPCIPIRRCKLLYATYRGDSAPAPAANRSWSSAIIDLREMDKYTFLLIPFRDSAVKTIIQYSFARRAMQEFHFLLRLLVISLSILWSNILCNGTNKRFFSTLNDEQLRYPRIRIFGEDDPLMYFLPTYISTEIALSRVRRCEKIGLSVSEQPERKRFDWRMI